MQVMKQQLELDMEQQPGSKLGKDYVKAKYCHPDYLTYMQSSVQSLSNVGLFVIPWTAAAQAYLSITNPRSLLKLVSIEPVMPSNHLILCHTLLFSLSVFPSIRVFSSESLICIRWPKYWSIRLNISPSNEYSGLISFRISPCCPRDSQESSTPQFKSINSSVLRFLYSSTLTSIHDYWKNHSFD